MYLQKLFLILYFFPFKINSCHLPFPPCPLLMLLNLVCISNNLSNFYLLLLSLYFLQSLKKFMCYSSLCISQSLIFHNLLLLSFPNFFLAPPLILLLLHLQQSQEPLLRHQHMGTGPVSSICILIFYFFMAVYFLYFLCSKVTLAVLLWCMLIAMGLNLQQSA